MLACSGWRNEAPAGYVFAKHKTVSSTQTHKTTTMCCVEFRRTNNFLFFGGSWHPITKHMSYATYVLRFSDHSTRWFFDRVGRQTVEWLPGRNSVAFRMMRRPGPSSSWDRMMRPVGPSIICHQHLRAAGRGNCRRNGRECIAAKILASCPGPGPTQGCPTVHLPGTWAWPMPSSVCKRIAISCK